MDPETPTKRFTCTLSEEDRRRLEDLAARRRTSKNDILRNALSLYAQIDKRLAGDGTVVLRDAEGVETVVIIT